MWTIYNQPGHFFIRKWVPISDPETHEKRGWVLLSMGTFQEEGQHDDWSVQTGGISTSGGGGKNETPSPPTQSNYFIQFYFSLCDYLYN